MTKQETIKIMAMLEAFYGMGKGKPEVMATAWHLVLEPYDYRIASKAVIEFARNDVREYATFPAVGKIVQAIRDEEAKEQAPINEIIRAISYGRQYKQLSESAKRLISDERYDEWLSIDAEEFANKAGAFADSLKDNRKRLQE